MSLYTVRIQGTVKEMKVQAISQLSNYLPANGEAISLVEDRATGILKILTTTGYFESMSSCLGKELSVDAFLKQQSKYFGSLNLCGRLVSKTLCIQGHSALEATYFIADKLLQKFNSNLNVRRKS